MNQPYQSSSQKYYDYLRQMKGCKNHKELYSIITKAYSDKGLSYYDIDLLDEYAAQYGLHLLLDK